MGGLLERETQLASLHQYAEEARGRDGRLVLVSGEAGIAQEHTVFAGAAGCAAVAAVLALVLFRGAATRALPSRPWVNP